MENDYQRIPIPGFEGFYDVDTEGVIYSVRKNKPMKGQIINSGYLTVDLKRHGVRTRRTVHRLVATAFIPNPLGLPQINHKDENRLNNSVSNLEWCTAIYNVNYGTGIERHRQKLIGRAEPMWKRKQHSAWMKEYRRLNSGKTIVCMNDNKTYRTYEDVSKAYGIERHQVSMVCKGLKESAKGFVFKEIREVNE